MTPRTARNPGSGDCFSLRMLGMFMVLLVLTTYGMAPVAQVKPYWLPASIYGLAQAYSVFLLASSIALAVNRLSSAAC